MRPRTARRPSRDDAIQRFPAVPPVLSPTTRRTAAWWRSSCAWPSPAGYLDHFLEGAQP